MELSIPILLVLFSVSIYNGAALVVIAHVLLGRFRRIPNSPDATPPVTIFKPLKGTAPGLEQNLASFARQDYPAFQLIFAAQDPTDPALAVARRVAAQHPDCDIKVLSDFPERYGSPKVNLLLRMLPDAKHDLLIISDDCVRIAPNFLRRSLHHFRDARVGLVYPPYVGQGEQNLGAALENFTILGLAGIFAPALRLVLRIPAVTGKCMMFRRRALRDAGGFHPVRHAAADDQLLADRIVRAGWKTRVSQEPAQCIHQTWPARMYLKRHTRWAAMRVRLAKLAYPLEIFFSPVVLALLVAPFHLALAPGIFLAAAVARILVDSLALRVLRGNFPRLRHALLIPVKDLVLFALWCTPFISNRLDWRGNIRYIGRHTRLVAPETYHRARLWRSLRADGVHRADRPQPAPAAPHVLSFDDARKKKDESARTTDRRVA